jgi:hypothetical protein
MTTPSWFPPKSLLCLAIGALSMLLLLGFADRASAYEKPPGGKWNYKNLFDDTTRGALSLAKNSSKVTKLVLVAGEDEAERCGKEPIRLFTKPVVKSYRNVSGRYAVANLKGGLFVGKPMIFTQGEKRFRATLELLWNEDGRIVEGQFEREQAECYLSFYARKGS